MMIMDDDDDEWLCWFGCCWFCLNTTQKNFPVDDTQHQDHLKFLTKSHSKKSVDVDCYDFDCWF